MTSTNALVAAVLQRLQGNLPALAAAEGLPAVTEFLDHDPPALAAVRSPQVWVDLAGEDRGSIAAFGGANARQARNRTVLVGVSVAGPDASVAAGRLRAYADLVLQVMESEQRLGGQALRVQWLRTDFSPNLAQGATMLFQVAVLTFSIPRWAPLGED